MSARKKPARKRGLSHIRPVRSGGTWKWQALVKIDGRQHTAPLRITQEAAYQDARKLLGVRAAMAPSMPLTLRDALEAVIAEARARGLSDQTVRGDYENPANALLNRYVDGDTLMAAIDEEAVCELIRRALGTTYDRRDGKRTIKPTTVQGRYMRVLNMAFRAAGLESPVASACKRMSPLLRAEPARMAFFTAEEAGAVLERVRAYEGRIDPERHQLELDLLTVLLHTGVRSGELSRVQVMHVDLDRARLQVIPKDRRNPREAFLTQPALEAMARMVDGLPPEAHVVPGISAGKNKCPRQHYLNRLFEKWKRRLGEPRLNGRALRHSFGTGLLATGAHVAELRDALGHRPSSTATMRYLHSAEQTREHAVKRLSDAIEGGRARSPRPSDSDSDDASGEPGPP